jgi:hypothetical protein
LRSGKCFLNIDRKAKAEKDGFNIVCDPPVTTYIIPEDPEGLEVQTFTLVGESVMAIEPKSFIDVKCLDQFLVVMRETLSVEMSGIDANTCEDYALYWEAQCRTHRCELREVM